MTAARADWQIPAAAWSRGLGVPYDEAGRKRVPEDAPMIDDGPWGGVPLGGLGAGAIGRSHRGDFARWHLQVGTHQFQSLPANQFSVFVRQGKRQQAHVLAPLRPSVLSEWNWDMPVGAGTYYGLFPKAWFVYDWDVLPVRLSQKQFSPIIPHNYRESSYPVGLFEWRLENPTSEPLTAGLMFTWQNLIGRRPGREWEGGQVNTAVKRDRLTGIVMTSDQPGDVRQAWDGTFAIATPEQPGASVTYRSSFRLSDGAALWRDFSAGGLLDDGDRTPAGPREIIAGALAVTVQLAPGEVRLVPFALAWDLPIVEFGSGTQWYKRYTRFYGTGGREAFQIAADALADYPRWEAAVDAWQRPILDDSSKPDWYKTALFNELYYLVDGGTLWENGRVGGSPPADGLGSFALLECYDYPFYNTLDVNFYASYALARLWPELEQRVIRDFAATVPLADPQVVRIQATKRSAPRKASGALPHDLGAPFEDPLLRANAYTYQDVNIWKDLNSKFVLQVWRDYALFKDRALVHDVWPAVVEALEYLHRFDRDDDGLPDHDDVPDQTYDTWPMSGASAYGGSLWLAALAGAVEMGRLEGEPQAVERYAAWLKRGQASFEAKLWNGRYYRYDASGGLHSDSIMADQLAGQWYADAGGLPAVVPPDHIVSALRTIYETNVRRFAGGRMGAVNGMRPDGTIDQSSQHSAEVWPGTTYALAAFMLHRGLSEEAWATAKGVYEVTYRRGYWFRTPEAYDIQGNFRASLYLRPLSIWAMEHALQMTRPT